MNEDQIIRRRTFAIISHPDAGKTTLTEKLLLYGGAASRWGTGSIWAARHATSDWMKLEQERGISVTSSVMQFEYDGYHVNLLDTPGHEDFSEDTYRTLVAADSAVMLLDNRRGVEERTRQLFDVCKKRRIPIFTFVNKCDRAGEDPLKLVSDVEADLDIKCHIKTIFSAATKSMGRRGRKSLLARSNQGKFAISLAGKRMSSWCTTSLCSTRRGILSITRS